MPKPTRKSSSRSSTRSSRREYTPRPYLSWSQLDLFERDPQAYLDKYVRGVEFDSAAMKLGRKVHAAIEEDDDGGDALIAGILSQVPRYDHHEFELLTKLDGVPLFGVLDGFNRKPPVIGEVKTGKKWTQAMADRSGQITFYATLVVMKTGKLPERIALHWAPTLTVEGFGPRLDGGRVRTFVTTRTMKDVYLMAPRISKAWAGIKRLYTQEVKNLL